MNRRICSFQNTFILAIGLRKHRPKRFIGSSTIVEPAAMPGLVSPKPLSVLYTRRAMWKHGQENAYNTIPIADKKKQLYAGKTIIYWSRKQQTSTGVPKTVFLE